MTPPGNAPAVSRIDALRVTLVLSGFSVGRLLPLRTRVVLATAHADRIGGNLAWIRDELRRAPTAFDVVEFAHRAPRGRREVGLAAFRSLRAGYLLATS